MAVQGDVGATRLLERERELEALDAAIARGPEGTAGLVLVEGPAGIGKSRLVAEARRRATERGLTVLAAYGRELERDFPFGVVRQLFEPRLADDAVRTRALSGAAATASIVLGIPPAHSDAPAGGSFASLHGLYWLTANLSAEAPLLLAIDDLHWCDDASLRYLAYVSHRLEGLPVLVMASARPTESGNGEALLTELAREPGAHLLTPGQLSCDAVRAVVHDRLGDRVDPSFAEACHASTEGNPLLLTELLKELRAEHVRPDAEHVAVVAELGPRAASRSVLLRLARLPAEAVSMARALAVLGDGASLPVVGALSGLGREAIAAASRELVRAEIIRPDPPLGFVHPLVQAAIYRDLAPGERELGHERAARLLLDLDAPAELVAAHVLEMPRHGEEWVVDILRAAANASFAKGAPGAAISSLRRVLAEPLPPNVRAELLFELGRAQALTSLPESAGALRSAYESARDPESRGHAADWLACTLVFLQAPDEAAEIARRATLELPSELDDLGRQLEASELISLFFGAQDDDGERLGRLRSHRRIDTARGAGAKMLAAVAAWEWAESAGQADEVVALAGACLQDRTLVAADTGYLVVAAILPLALADLDEAVDRWDAVRAEAHRSGFVFTSLAAQLWGRYTHHLRGELDEAETELRAALVTAAHWGVPTQQPWAQAVLAELLVDRGAVTEARALLDTASHPRPGSDPSVFLDRAQMRVLLAEGRAEEALAYCDVFQSDAGWRRHPRYVPWRSLKAQALDRLGRGEEAVALAADELEIARAWGSPGTVGRSLRVLGTLERDRGLGRLREAVEILDGSPARLEHAKALAALGGTLRRQGRPTEARQPLHHALELADVCGAEGVVAAVKAELHAAGARPRRTAMSGVRSLTASQKRVAQLAAEGSSNREIAQMLFVTPKTVEVHLSAVYQKLGIRGRGELTRALANA